MPKCKYLKLDTISKQYEASLVFKSLTTSQVVKSLNYVLRLDVRSRSHLHKIEVRKGNDKTWINILPYITL